MLRREIKHTQERVQNSDESSDQLDAIIGEVRSEDDEEREDEDLEFDEANEPTGDPGKNVPSA